MAEKIGVHVVIPYAPGEMPLDRYKDGFHLNFGGAREFTERAVPDVASVLVESAEQSSSPR